MIDDETNIDKLKLEAELLGFSSTNANPCGEIDFKDWHKGIGVDYTSLITPILSTHKNRRSYPDIFKLMTDSYKLIESNNATCDVDFRTTKIKVKYGVSLYTTPDKQKIIKLTPEQYCKITVNFLTELVKFTEQGIDVFTAMFKCELETSVKDLLSKFNIGEQNVKS